MSTSPSSIALRLPLLAGGPPVLAVEYLPGTRADAPPVLFCAGFHSSMRGDKARAVETHCARHGLACIRFDYRGHGESGGAAETLTLHDWLDDTLAVVDAAGEAPPFRTAAGAAASAAAREPDGGDGAAVPPLVVVGSSMGAWLAVHVARRRPRRIASLLLVAAAPDFLQDTLPARLDAGARARLARGRHVRLDTPDDPAGWPVTPALLDSGRALGLLTGPAAVALGCPVRMLHGTADDTAPWARAAALLERLGAEDATLALIGGADHRLSTPRELRRLTDTLDELVGLAGTRDPAGHAPSAAGPADGAASRAPFSR